MCSSSSRRTTSARTCPAPSTACAPHVPDADVLVVDDGSPDGTGELAEKIAESEATDRAGRSRRVHVLHRAGKLGLGTAYVAGFGWALERGYDVVVEMDADGSHRARGPARDSWPRSRTRTSCSGRGGCPGGACSTGRCSRHVLSRGANTYTRIMLGIPLRDATGGFRAYRADAAARRSTLDDVASQGYCFQVDMAWRAVRAGARVVEVPDHVRRARARAASKMSRAIVVEALFSVTRWGIAERSRRVAGAFRRSGG